MDNFILSKLVRGYTEDASQDEIMVAIPQAFIKLEHIIQREGDMEGKRLDPDYLAQLISEQIIAERAFNRSISEYKEKRRLSLVTA